jgi:hypothetical protein
VAAGFAGRQNIESRGKLKMSPKCEQFLGTFKTTREDRTLWPKIQLVSRTLAVPPEIRNRNGKLEKLHENLNRRLEGERLRRRFELPRENLNLPRIVEGAAGKLKSSDEE